MTLSFAFKKQIWAFLSIARKKDLNQASSQYLAKYSVFYAFFVVISGGAYAALQLLNSRLFGKPYFNMKLYPSELIAFSKFRVLLVVILEVTKTEEKKTLDFCCFFLLDLICKNQISKPQTSNIYLTI